MKKKVKPIICNILAAVVIFSIIIPMDLFSKRQSKGAQLLIVKEDGRVIEGELLAVKDSSLLLMTAAGGTEAKVDISEVNEIAVKKKKNALAGFVKGGLWGLIVGGTVSFLVYRATLNDGDGYNGFIFSLMGGLAIAVPGSLVGGLPEVLGKDYKKIKVKGQSSPEIQQVLKKLQEKARFK